MSSALATIEVNGKAIVWSEPISRGDLRLVPGDIGDAIAWYKDKTGQEPKLIMLNVKNENFVSEVPEGIKVICRGGVLCGEVWFCAGDNFVTPTSHEQTISEYGQKRRNEIDMRYILPAGRPTIDLPVEKVKEFVSQGLGCRAIAKKLKVDGIEVSHMAVHRAIKKLQWELQLGGDGDDLSKT